MTGTSTILGRNCACFIGLLRRLIFPALVLGGGVVFLSVAHAQTVEEHQLFTLGSEWQYFDDGAAPNGWKEPDFDDSSWATGRGQFGYGDGDEETVIGFGGDPNNRNITSYFRKRFTVSLTDALEGFIGVQRDDGAVVYLNGREIFRTNMPGGTINDNTRLLPPAAM